MALRPEGAGHLLRDVHAAPALVIQADPACSSSASRRIAGSSLPRAEARRRIPRQALGLKEYPSGASACKISDKVTAASSLGDSPMLRIKSSVRNAPSVSHVNVGVGPSVFLRHRHRGPRLCDTDDRIEDRLEVEALIRAEGPDNVMR